MYDLILIVDDEPDITSTVQFNLQAEGFRTLVADTGEQGLALANSEPMPDLVILDLMLPDVSGTEVCRRLRQTDTTRRIPIVMLTAKTEPIDRVVGFEVGADDYVTKPFSVRELVLRVKAILRRTEPTEQQVDSFKLGVLQIDVPGHRVWVENQEVMLTALEFRLLVALVKRKGRVQTRDALLNQVWEMASDVTTRTVDTHVRRLRKKLGRASDYIETLRGVGYRFRPEAQEPGRLG
jgi:two-component system, OmpR family, phosphate regulon response regulator PhoB